MNTNYPVKILQVTIGDGSFGGVASFLYTYYSHMDHSKVHFDFLYCGENSMQSKEGDSIFSDSKFTSLHILKNYNNGFREYKILLTELRKVFENDVYDIVHVNSSNPFLNVCIAYALKGRAKLIAHSHSIKAKIEYSKRIKRWIKKQIMGPSRYYIIRKADALFACSKEAGRYLFGESAIWKPNFKIIHNAIDVDKFTYNAETRKRIRGQEKRTIFGFVGRLTDAKNIPFILEVFREIHNAKEDTVLWIIGEGEQKEKTEKKITELQLCDSVEMMGLRTDVAELMQAMDAFLLPSLYEGLSIVAIEAQAAGLPVFASDSISPEHKVTELVTFISLGKTPKEWADIILQELSKMGSRKSTWKELSDAGYEIGTAAMKLEKTYIQMKG